MSDVWSLAKLDWLRSLPDEEAERLRRASRREELAAGSLVFSPERHPRSVCILERGLVRIFRVSPEGAEVAFGYVHPGEVFGELAVFSERPRESFAQAVRRSVVWTVPRETFATVARSHPDVLYRVAQQMEGRFKQIESRVEDLALRDAASRLGRVLLQLGEQFGEPMASGLAIELPLTQSEIASLVGTSRQTVNAVLRGLAERGLLAREGRRLRLLAPERLRREVEEGRVAG